MAKFTRRMLSIMIASSLAACGGGGSGGASTSSQGGGAASQYRVAGQVQKGPFIFGSQIWISELNDKLSPTGKVYMTQTSDDLGNFSIPGSVDSKLVELTGSGYYMNELSGTLSTAPVTLNAVADLSISKSLTINLLTTLQAPRLKALMAGGNDYQTAYKQSRNEVLAIFGIDSGKVDNLGSLFDMRINGTADQDSILLATSAILSQVARNSGTATETAELSHLISTIASDLANNGKINSTALQQKLIDAAAQVDLENVRRNVETYYANRGIALVAPKFEEWIDSDNSHILPRRVTPFPGLSLSNIQDVEPSQVITSNSLKITGVAPNQFTPVYVTGGATLIKNNSLIKGSSTTAQTGDIIALQDRSPGFGTTRTSKLTIGASQASWSISSTNAKLVSFEKPIAINGTSLDYKNLAIAISASTALKVKYLGIFSQDNGKDDYTAQIYDADPATYTPGKPIATLTRVFNYFGNASTSMTDPKDGTPVSFNLKNIQFKFGPDGFIFEQWKNYFLVLKKKDGSNVSITPYKCSNCIKMISSSQDAVNWITVESQSTSAPIWLAY